MRQPRVICNASPSEALHLDARGFEVEGLGFTV